MRNRPGPNWTELRRPAAGRRLGPDQFPRAWSECERFPNQNDGRRLDPGEGQQATRLVAVEPPTLESATRLLHPRPQPVAPGTVAMPVGDGPWAGSLRGDRRAILAATTSLYFDSIVRCALRIY